MDIRGHINCWRFVGRDCRFPNHDCFNVRIHDGVRTGRRVVQASTLGLIYGQTMLNCPTPLKYGYPL